MRAFASRARRDLRRNYNVYVMALPMVAFYVLFHYMPLYGAVIAFKRFSPGLGILRSPWVGVQNFTDFFGSIYFGRILRNTLLLNVQYLLFGFPAPILFALLLNELRATAFKRVVQTISYLPHFISTMVICSMIMTFVSRTGVVTDLLVALGMERTNMLLEARYFQPIYVISEIWQTLGWNSIIYIAAISGVDAELYEAAEIDGARRVGKMWHVTLPGIMPTIIILLILKLGQMLNVGYEKIILLYNSNTYETADVISSYVYRKGLLDFDYSYSTAVGLFNSAINFLLLVSANAIGRRFNEISLW